MVLADTDRLLDAAMEMIAESGWHSLTLAGLAEYAGVDLQDVKRHFSTKRRLLVVLADRFDRAAMDAIDPDAADPSVPVRERLFDALMTRFELLQEHRAAHVALLNAARTDPAMLAIAAPRVGGAMEKLLRKTSVGARGPILCVQSKVLSALYLSVLRVWVGDESEDLGPTMSALDRNLARLDELVASLPFCRNMTAKC